MIPEVAILISFVIFAVIFYFKVIPILKNMIDKYIMDVQKKIEDAEKIKDEASLLLKEAYVNKDSVDEVIAANKHLSDTRIAEIKRQNEEHLEVIKKRYEASLKKQLDAELVRQKNILINQLADLVIKKLSEKIKNEDYQAELNISRNDLLKLMDKGL